MPVIRPMGRGEPVALLRKHLAELLVQELLGKGSQRGPLIFEIPTGLPDRNDVIVVWEAWGHLSPQDRSAIIREAYARLNQILQEGLPPLEPTGEDEPPVLSRVGTAIGATWEDVERSDLLPWSVVPQIQPENDDDRDAMRLLMIEAGGFQTPGGIRLRFPTFELASEAQARLNEAMPEVHWASVKDVGTVEDWINR